MQKKFASTGKFTVFFSNVQKNDKATVEHFKTKAPDIPTYHQVRLPHAPCGGGIPYAVLMDHTGKVVGKGRTSEMIAKVEALVKAAPDAIPPILGDVEVKHCKSQAKTLTSGRSITTTLKGLTKLGEGDSAKAKEAKAIVEAVNTYLETEQKRLAEQAEKQPAKTLTELEAFCKQTKGLAQCADAANQLKELKKDKAVGSLAKILKTIQESKAKIAKGSKSKITAKKLASAKKSLSKLIDSDKTPAGVKAEASAALEKQ